MPDTPLNPDALEAAAEAIATRNGFGYAQFSHKGDAHAAVRAYLSSLPVAPLELTNAEWQAFQAIPDQGYSHRAWVDARIAERVAVAQPEVNSVEELEALPGGSIVKSGGREFYKTSYVELPWILPYGADRFGSEYLAKHSKVTVIHRPEVNDA